jgi:acyl carrier protein
MVYAHRPGIQGVSPQTHRPDIWCHPSQLVEDLRTYLTAKLPAYMVPSAFYLLDAFPLTPNGKLNRQALPDIESQAISLTRSITYTAPRNDAEEAIAAIWRELLGIKRIGIWDNFFELGGHSLLATQCIARITNIYAVELPLRAMFETPTVEGLARLLEDTLLDDLESLSEDEAAQLMESKR